MDASTSDAGQPLSRPFPKPDRTNYVARALAAFNLAFDRKLGNLAGCNMTFRAGPDRIYITRSGATKARLGKLHEEDLILAGASNRPPLPDHVDRPDKPPTYY